MLSKEELRYLLALQKTPSFGDITLKKLLSKIGSAEGVFKEKKSSLYKLDESLTGRLKNLNKKQQLEYADDEIRFIEDQEIDWYYFMNSDYPDLLRHCADGPVLLFGKGNIDLKSKRLISIVGTRESTTYGEAFCEDLIAELAPLNPVIVSGLAYGIDICAHKAAIKNNLQTIACLGHGLNQIYPKKHEKYKKKIFENGGFFTDFWSTDSFEPTNFLRRNRIVAGISQATIVIESAERGGSLHTAELALSYHREVFAVPGRSTDVQSRGSNNLIKHQKAHMLTSAADLIYHLGWEITEKPKPVQTRLFVEMDEEEKKIYNFLKDKEKELLDIIAIECGLPVFRVATLLMDLELKGIVRPLPGKLFQLI